MTKIHSDNKLIKNIALTYLGMLKLKHRIT